MKIEQLLAGPLFYTQRPGPASPYNDPTLSLGLSLSLGLGLGLSLGLGRGFVVLLVLTCTSSRCAPKL